MSEVYSTVHVIDKDTDLAIRIGDIWIDNLIVPEVRSEISLRSSVRVW